MELAIVAAEYTQTRPTSCAAMAAWKRHGSLEPHRVRLTERMLAKGYQPDFIARIFEQIKGFGSYGFPESHAASFALLTYASCWLKRHEPAAFACALINSWPMGFYNPDQILQDARRHRLEIRPVDVRHSGWDCSLEPSRRHSRPSAWGYAWCAAFGKPMPSASKPHANASHSQISMTCAFAPSSNRVRASSSPMPAPSAAWPAIAIERAGPLPESNHSYRCSPACPHRRKPPSTCHCLRWVKTFSTTTRPLARRWGRILCSCYEMSSRPGAAAVLGNWARSSMAARSALPAVIGRQRPQTASGVIFVTLEDEFGMVNVVVGGRAPEATLAPVSTASCGWPSGVGQRRTTSHRRPPERPHAPAHGLDVRSRDFQ